MHVEQEIVLKANADLPGRTDTVLVCAEETEASKWASSRKHIFLRSVLGSEPQLIDDGELQNCKPFERCGLIKIIPVVL